MKNFAICGKMGSDRNDKATFQVGVKNNYKSGGKIIFLTRSPQIFVYLENHTLKCIVLRFLPTTKIHWAKSITSQVYLLFLVAPVPLNFLQGQ